MLTLWRRHREKCPNKSDRYYRRCKCAVWCEGTVEGKYLRQSLKTRSWERGDELKKQLEDGKHEEQQITIEAALKAFIRDCESRNLNNSTLRKYRRLADTLRGFADVRRIVNLQDVSADVARDYRHSWKLSPRTAS